MTSRCVCSLSIKPLTTPLAPLMSPMLFLSLPVFFVRSHATFTKNRQLFTLFERFKNVLPILLVSTSHKKKHEISGKVTIHGLGSLGSELPGLWALGKTSWAPELTGLPTSLGSLRFSEQQQLLGNVLLQNDLHCRLGVDLSGGLRLDQNQNFAQIFSICFFP